MTAWTWDGSLFRGAAAYYDRGRLPYAPGLADALRNALGLDGEGSLLDVGCGPGSVTLLFAHLFQSVVGLDADAEMLAEAARLAPERGVTNARWVCRRAEDLPAGLGAFRAVTFAASFHWMDRLPVARAVRGMLAPGGVLVHVDNHHQDGTEAAHAPYPAPPVAEVTRLREAYLGPGRRAGQSILLAPVDGEDEVFRAAGFSGPERVLVPDGRRLLRTTDDLVAETLSMSGSAPHHFGDRVAAFEADLRALLAAASPSGRFAVRLPDNELKVWRPTPGA